jgi:hypothetical protein
METDGDFWSWLSVCWGGQVKMRDAIRENRNVAPPRDPQVISRIGNMWYNPKLPAGYNAAAAAWQKKGVRRHGHLLRARVPLSRRVIEAEGEDGGHGNGCRKRPLPASSHSPQAKRTKATVSGKTTSQAHPSGRKSPKGKAALAAPSALKLPSPATLTSSAVAKEQRVERSHRLARSACPPCHYCGCRLQRPTQRLPESASSPRNLQIALLSVIC